MENRYQILKRAPTLEEYIELCTIIGWKDFMNFEVAQKSLDQSIFGTVIQYQDKIVGMGRIIGDGAIYYYIQDIVVSPEHQNKGLGKLILETLMEYLSTHAPHKAFVGLFANEGTQGFYRKHGFHAYDAMEGMFKVMLNEGKGNLSKEAGNQNE